MLLFFVLQNIQDEVAEIYEKYHGMMGYLAFSILKDYQLAEDAVQEALLSISQNIDKLDDIDSDRSRNYIYTVTKNTSLSLLRKMKFENNVQYYETKELNNIEGELDINAFCNAYGLSDRVTDALLQLSEIERELIILKYGEGYTGKEIACIIGKEPDFVYKRLQRALKKLNIILKETET